MPSPFPGMDPFLEASEEFGCLHDGMIIFMQQMLQRRLPANYYACSIEILSLTNKAPGLKGQKLYRRKQREIMQQKVHLVEIDLLRAGKHSSAVALDWAKKKTGDFDYHVRTTPALFSANSIIARRSCTRR